METSVLKLIVSLWDPGSQRPREGQNLVLAGISQTVFRNQWGEPETRFGLRRLGNFHKFGPLFLITDSIDETPHSVWIYKKRNRILFFTKKRLVSHFRWTEFKERYSKPFEEIDSTPSRTRSSFTTSTLALVA